MPNPPVGEVRCAASPAINTRPEANRSATNSRRTQGMIDNISKSNGRPNAVMIAARTSSSLYERFSSLPTMEKRKRSRPSIATMVAKVPSGLMMMKR